MISYTVVKKLSMPTCPLQGNSGFFINSQATCEETCVNNIYPRVEDAMDSLMKRIGKEFSIKAKADPIAAISEDVGAFEKNKQKEKPKKKETKPIPKPTPEVKPNPKKKSIPLIVGDKLQKIEKNIPKGFTLQPVSEDIHSAFRCFSKQLFNDQNAHFSIRQKTAAYIRKNEYTFEPLISIDFKLYLGKIRGDEIPDTIALVASAMSHKVNLYILKHSDTTRFETIYTNDKSIKDIFLFQSEDNYFHLMTKISEHNVPILPMTVLIKNKKEHAPVELETKPSTDSDSLASIEIKTAKLITPIKKGEKGNQNPETSITKSQITSSTTSVGSVTNNGIKFKKPRKRPSKFSKTKNQASNNNSNTKEGTLKYSATSNGTGVKDITDSTGQLTINNKASVVKPNPPIPPRPSVWKTVEIEELPEEEFSITPPQTKITITNIPVNSRPQTQRPRRPYRNRIPENEQYYWNEERSLRGDSTNDSIATSSIGNEQNKVTENNVPQQPYNKKYGSNYKYNNNNFNSNRFYQNRNRQNMNYNQCYAPAYPSYAVSYHNDTAYYHYFNYPQYPFFYYPTDYIPFANYQPYFQNVVPVNMNYNLQPPIIETPSIPNIDVHPEDINNPSQEPCEVTTPRRYDTEETPVERLEMYKPTDSSELPELFIETPEPTNVNRFNDPTSITHSNIPAADHFQMIRYQT